MARTDALSINIDATTADKLAEIQGFVIETIQKNAVSEKIKNTKYSGDPTTGSVEIDRFKNAQVDDYGTARAAGAGKKILNTGKVTININEDKEIVEEIAKKDVKLYGIASIMDKRKKNQALRMIADLDTRFFAQMVTDGTEVTVDDYEPEKIQLSNNYDCSLFYSCGTKAVMPDLIRYANIAEA